MHQRLRTRYTGQTKPPSGARLIKTHPLAQNLVIALPFLEGQGLFTKDHASGYNVQFLEGTHPGTTTDIWSSTPYGLAPDFRGGPALIGNYNFCGDADSYLSADHRRPVFAGKELTVLAFGKLAEVTLWRHVLSVASQDTDPTGNNWHILCGVCAQVFGKQMYCHMGDTAVYSNVVLSNPHVWAHFIWRFKSDEFVDFIFWPVADDTPKFQHKVIAASLATTVRDEFKIGNEWECSNSWRYPLVYLYMWNRFVTDNELKQVVSAPYQFFR